MNIVLYRSRRALAALSIASALFLCPAGPTLASPDIVFPSEVISAPPDPDPRPFPGDPIFFATYVSLDDGRMLFADIFGAVAYIYRKRADGWEYRDRLLFPEGYYLPCGAELHDDIALICASDLYGGPPSVLVFQRNAGKWSFLQALPGRILTFVSDGKTIAITEPGVVSLYARTRSGLRLRAQIFPPQPGPSFGSALALDDNTLMVGSPQYGSNSQGVVYVYERRHGVWQLEQQLSSSDLQTSFGSGVGLEGRIAVVGARNAGRSLPVLTDQGAAYVFVKENGYWHERQKLSNPTNGSFALDVVATDGRRLFLDSHYIRPHDDDSVDLADGVKVFVYARHAGEWTIERELVPPTTSPTTSSTGSNEFASQFSIDGCSFLTSNRFTETPDPVFEGEAYLYDTCRD